MDTPTDRRTWLQAEEPVIGRRWTLDEAREELRKMQNWAGTDPLKRVMIPNVYDIHIAGGEQIDTNERGGMQSKLSTRYDLLDGLAMGRLVRVLKLGADKYADDNWRLISEEEHLNHAMFHLMNYLDELRGRLPAPLEQTVENDELGHAFCRLFMMVAVNEQGGPLDDSSLGGLKNG